MTSTKLDASTDVVRVVYRDRPPLSLNDLWTLSARLLDLLSLTNRVLDSKLKGEGPSILTFETGKPVGASAESMDKAKRQARRDTGLDITIDRVSYHSPLELILVIYTGGAAFLTLAARWAKVRADLARSGTIVRSEHVKQAAHKVLLQYIEEDRQTTLLEVLTAEEPEGPPVTVNPPNKSSLLDDPAEALIEIETVEKLD